MAQDMKQCWWLSAAAGCVPSPHTSRSWCPWINPAKMPREKKGLLCVIVASPKFFHLPQRKPLTKSQERMAGEGMEATPSPSIRWREACCGTCSWSPPAWDKGGLTFLSQLLAGHSPVNLPRLPLKPCSWCEWGMLSPFARHVRSKYPCLPLKCKWKLHRDQIKVSSGNKQGLSFLDNGQP